MDQPPLFETYPELHDQIPWVSIIAKPTPVRQMTKLQEYLQTDEPIWVKLDNLTSDKYGGNKVRKLEFLIADALHRKKHTIATMGGLGTNHGLATTIHGRAHNLQTLLYLTSQPVAPQVLQNLKLMHYYGAELVYAKNKRGVTLRFYLLDRIRRRRTYWLPMGGSTRIGTLGYVNAIFELRTQIEEGLLPEPRWIFIPAGSVGTIAGIELGLRPIGLQTRVMGICVAPHLLARSSRVNSLVQSAFTLLKLETEKGILNGEPQYELTDEFAGSGYGQPTKEGTEAIELAAQLEDLILDPTYTGKTLAGLIAHIHQGNPGPILYWHTLNSVNLSAIANQVDYRDLPKSFHQFFDERTPS